MRCAPPSLALAALLLTSGTAAAADPAAAGHDRELSQGYAQLYDAASGLRWLDELLALKFESDDTRRVLTDLAHYASQLKAELERVAHDDPSLSLKDDGLPALEKNKRTLMQRDRIRSLAPITGATGADFERTLLLTQSGVLNQLRFLVAALVEAEAGSPRHDWILGVQGQIDRNYVAIVRLLDRRFFCPPAHSPTGEAGKVEQRPPNP